MSRLLCSYFSCLHNCMLTTCPSPYPSNLTQKCAHKDNCVENVKTHNENLNLQKEQPASAWGWVNPGLSHFMAPHHWGPLRALSSFRTSTTPFNSPKGGCWLLQSPPIHFVKSIWTNESQNNAQWALLYHPWSGYEETGIWGKKGDESGRWRGGWTCRHFVCIKVGWWLKVWDAC